MAFFNEAWFIHAVNDVVHVLSQQKRTVTTGATRVKDGVVGKTWPFQILGSLEMQPVIARDADTQYLNPPQTKRRAQLTDFAAAVLIDEFDEVKMLANPQSEFAQILAYARNRKLDGIVIPAIDGTAITVNEAGETTGTQALPAAQLIANGGTGLTMAKVRQAKFIMDDANVDADDRYMLVSPKGVQQLLTDSTVTSSDYSTLHALEAGALPFDATWYGFMWRMSTQLAKSGNIRNCLAWQKMGVGLATANVTSLEIDKAVHKNNNTQVLAKLSGGAVRVEDQRVVQIGIDESV